MTNTVVLGVGSSLGDRFSNLEQARTFLRSLSLSDVLYSSVWESEPVGPAENTFLNCVIAIEYDGTPHELLEQLKKFEVEAGRDLSATRWSDRVIDIDIIDFGHRLYIDCDLEIPHTNYMNRRFVLIPLREIYPEWTDPCNGCHIDDMIAKTAPIRLSNVSSKW